MSLEYDLLTAHKIAKLMAGPKLDNAGDRFKMRFVQQHAGYLPKFRQTLDWMLVERLIGTEGIGKPGEGARMLFLTDAGKMLLIKHGSDTREFQSALAFPDFVYEMGPQRFVQFALGCIEQGIEPGEVLRGFLDSKKSTFSLDLPTQKVA